MLSFLWRITAVNLGQLQSFCFVGDELCEVKKSLDKFTIFLRNFVKVNL